MKTILRFALLLALPAALFCSCSKDGGDDTPDNPPPATYAITMSADANGTAAATVDGSVATTAQAGATVTITATPATNYVFKQWVAVSGSLPTFATGSASTSPATFTMPAAAVNIKAEFEAGILINGVRWAETNVDAPGTFAAAPESPGMFYQWNRLTAWPATGDVTGWDSNTPTGNSWETANDPCPAGWRVPTTDEQGKLLEGTKVTREWLSGATSVNGVNGYRFTDKTTQATIFLPAAGYRYYSDGTLGDVGYCGFYWSGSSYSADDAWLLVFYGYANLVNANQANDYRTNGFSVRCVRQFAPPEPPAGA